MGAIYDGNIIEVIDESKNTNLHKLALNGEHYELTKFEAGSKIDTPNAYGLTPLMLAARFGQLEAIKVLLDLRADATKVNKYGGSVFLMAVASGSLDVVNLLLQHLLQGGVSRQALENQLSPISLSILFGHEHVFKFLIGNKFNVQSISLYTGLTPLMFAALNENPVFTKHLLMMGADPRVRNANNETCHDLDRWLNGPPEIREPPQQQHLPYQQQHQPYQQQPQQSTHHNPNHNHNHNQELHIQIPQYPYQYQQQHQQYEQPQHHPQHQQYEQPQLQPQPQQLQPQHQSPLIMISPQAAPYYNLMPMPRKSSNLCTPDEITPTVSPVGFYPQQMFFPADFTPSQYASPNYLVGRTYQPYNPDYVVSPVYGMGPWVFTSPYTHNVNTNMAEDVFQA
ncbi:putative POTE ankyrin domain family member M [Atheta coriaria]|uniref:putative POTE ankyrin domain family member M n=1 Tax=Dalotia coriaria TaxID=877792 RepID=UPI0031F40BFE